MKRIVHHDVYTSMLPLLFSICMFIITLFMPAQAAFFPRMILVFMIIISAVTLYQSFKVSKTINVENAKAAQYLKGNIIKTPLISALFILGYVVCMGFLGFFVSTALFLFTFMYYCGVKDFKKIFLIIICINLFMYLVLGLQLKIQFPQGLIF